MTHSQLAAPPDCAVYFPTQKRCAFRVSHATPHFPSVVGATFCGGHVWRGGNHSRCCAACNRCTAARGLRHQHWLSSRPIKRKRPTMTSPHSEVCSASHNAFIFRRAHPTLYPAGNSFIGGACQVVSVERPGHAPERTTKVLGRMAGAGTFAPILPPSRGTSIYCSAIHGGFTRPPAPARRAP